MLKDVFFFPQLSAKQQGSCIEERYVLQKLLQEV